MAFVHRRDPGRLAHFVIEHRNAAGKTPQAFWNNLKSDCSDFSVFLKFFWKTAGRSKRMTLSLENWIEEEISKTGWYETRCYILYLKSLCGNGQLKIWHLLKQVFISFHAFKYLLNNNWCSTNYRIKMMSSAYTKDSSKWRVQNLYKCNDWRKCCSILWIKALLQAC